MVPARCASMLPVSPQNYDASFLPRERIRTSTLYHVICPQIAGTNAVIMVIIHIGRLGIFTFLGIRSKCLFCLTFQFARFKIQVRGQHGRKAICVRHNADP